MMRLLLVMVLLPARCRDGGVVDVWGVSIVAGATGLSRAIHSNVRSVAILPTGLWLRRDAYDDWVSVVCAACLCGALGCHCRAWCVACGRGVGRSRSSVPTERRPLGGWLLLG